MAHEMDQTSENEFGFVNEERSPDGSYAYIDEWRYWRKPAGAALETP
jgi:hypothetical protein